MWQIKCIDNKTKHTRILKGNFITEESANDYLAENYKDKEDVWVEEKGSKEVKALDMSNKKGSWLWLYSKKKEEFFPYGLIVDYSSQFVKLQTKENVLDYFDLTDMRIERIKEMLQDGKGKFLEEGSFVNLKEYV